MYSYRTYLFIFFFWEQFIYTIIGLKTQKLTANFTNLLKVHDCNKVPVSPASESIHNSTLPAAKELSPCYNMYSHI